MSRNQNKFEHGSASALARQGGFTVTELLVVFLIMVLMAGLGILNWNSQVPRRNLIIAQNELTTNIRKIQGYAVSSRNISGVGSANFYVMRFEIDNNQYEVKAIDSNGAISGVIESGTLPTGLTIKELNLVDQEAQTITNPDCVFLIFNVIYAKVFLGGDLKCTDNYLSSLVVDPPALARQANYDLGIVITHTQTSQLKGVYIDGITGRVQTYTP